MTVKQPWTSSASSTTNPGGTAASSASGVGAGAGANNNSQLESSSSAAAAAAAAEGGVKTTANKRPKSVSQWSVVDVQKWFRRNCGDYYHLYSEKLLEQDITGKQTILIL